jgi:hypothetical protein
LRTRWHAAHADEVYFRDTAHGFLAWAVRDAADCRHVELADREHRGRRRQGGCRCCRGAVAAAGTAATGTLQGEAQGGATNAGNAGYFVDTLFRKDASTSTTAGTAESATPNTSGRADDAGRSTAEAGRIFATGLRNGSLPPEDAKYLGQQVAQRTGLSQEDAAKRVTDTFTAMKNKVDQAEATARAAAERRLARPRHTRRCGSSCRCWSVHSWQVLPPRWVAANATWSEPSHLRRRSMRSLLLLLLGVPIPIVILIALFSH